jgi:hypothetical protein
MTNAVKNRVTTPERKATPLVINGDMNIAQRSTSVTGLGDGDEGYVTVDRFRHTAAASSGRFTSKQTAVDDLDGFQNCLELDCTTADTSIAATELLQIDCRLEGQDMQHFKKGETNAEYITVSFYAKADAAVAYACELHDIDNSRHISKLFTTGTDWTHHVLSFPGDTTGNFGDDANESLRISLILHAGSNFTEGTLASSWASYNDANSAPGIGSFYASTDRSLKITGFQVEAGDYNATTIPPFQYESVGANLDRCQRYFWRLDTPSTGTRYSVGMNNTATDSSQMFYCPTMRDAPTVTFSDITISEGGTHRNATGASVIRHGDGYLNITFTVASGLTVAGASMTRASSTSGNIEFDSEL